MSSISITDLGQAEPSERISRLFARRVALWWALSRGELPDAARASARSRIRAIDLSPDERTAARHARLTLGRAIREARARALHGPIEVPLTTTMPVTAKPGEAGRSDITK